MEQIKPPINRLTVVGVGLIGGSICMAARAKNAARHITGVDVAANLGKIRRIVDVATKDLAEGLKDADLVILATPIPVTLKLLPRIAEMNPTCTVTDTASTKSEIFQTAKTCFKSPSRFVPGHPMAGAEKGGVSHARADLFEGAAWMLDPTFPSDSLSVACLTSFVAALGAKYKMFESKDHDAIVAATSHLPHLLAYTLAAQGAELQERRMADATPGLEPRSVAELIAGGWHSMTRTADSDPQLWTEISASNRVPLSNALREYRLRLADLQDALDKKDDVRLRQLLREGQEAKWKLSQ